MRPRILCVDDERHVLDGLQDTLRKSFDITTSTEPHAALALLDKGEPFDVIVSDMRMPLMNGAAFLASARIKAPDTVRVLLTGQADMADAIDAVNKGAIFRFLTKPCPREMLLPALAAATRQYRLAVAERAMLEETVRGCVRTLIEVMSLSIPEACGRANRISRYAAKLAKAADAPSIWEVETASLLSQLAAAEDAAAVLDAVLAGGPFGDDLRETIQSTPTLSARYLRHIPRFEPVAEILVRQASPARLLPSDDPVSLYAKIFRIAHDFELLETCGSDAAEALTTLRGRADVYDDRLLSLFATVCGAQATGTIRECRLDELTIGMRLVQNVHSAVGAVLVSKGQTLSDTLLSRLRDLRVGTVQEPITVRVGAD